MFFFRWEQLSTTAGFVREWAFLAAGLTGLPCERLPTRFLKVIMGKLFNVGFLMVSLSRQNNSTWVQYHAPQNQSPGQGMVTWGLVSIQRQLRRDTSVQFDCRSPKDWGEGSRGTWLLFLALCHRVMRAPTSQDAPLPARKVVSRRLESTPGDLVPDARRPVSSRVPPSLSPPPPGFPRKRKHNLAILSPVCSDPRKSESKTPRFWSFSDQFFCTVNFFLLCTWACNLAFLWVECFFRLYNF